MKRGVFLSGLLHLTAFLLLIYGSTLSFKHTSKKINPIIIDVVSENDKIFKKSKIEKNPEKKSKKTPPPMSLKQKKVNTKPEKPIEKSSPQPEHIKPIKKPTTKNHKPTAKSIAPTQNTIHMHDKSKPIKKPTQRPLIRETTIKPKTKQKSFKPKFRTKPPKTNFESVLKNLQNIKQNDGKDGEKILEVNKKGSNKWVQQIALMIQQQVAKRWDIQAGTKEAYDLDVEIRMLLNPDGSILKAYVIPNKDKKDDPFYISTSDSALRAVLDSNPFNLPPSQYKIWKDITLIFNPRKIFGD